MVSADQETILGNGTADNPLRAGHPVDASVFPAAFRGGSVAPRLGQPVFIAAVSVAGGITTVQPGTAIDDFSTSQVAGLIVDINADGTVQVKSSGLVELELEAWEAVVRSSGGLVLGATYFLAEFPAFATLTTIPPATPGVFVSRIGIALNARTMLLALPSQTTRNLDGATFRARFDGQPPPVGIAVRVIPFDGSARGTSNANQVEAAAVGLVVVVDGPDVVVQTSGIVTLADEQWSRITKNALGLSRGFPYYLTSDVQAGFFSPERPSAQGVVIAQIGVALSATQLLLSIPPFSVGAGTV